MPDPTLYFPEVHYALYEGGYQWNTLVNKSASGRRSQVRLKGGDDPLRILNCRVSYFGEDGHSLPMQTIFNEDVATVDEFFTFLRTVKGQWRRFFIFNPKAWDIRLRIRLEIDADSHTILMPDGDITLPVKFGQQFSTFGYVPAVEGEDASFLTDWFPWLDDDYVSAPKTFSGHVNAGGGDGGEWQILSTPALPAIAEVVSPGFHWFTFPFRRAHERIAVRFSNDNQPFQFDGEMSDPPHEIQLSMMEDDGTDET